jgi:hypothetical protein
MLRTKRKTSAEKADKRRAKDVKAMIADTVTAAFINMVQEQIPAPSVLHTKM